MSAATVESPVAAIGSALVYADQHHLTATFSRDLGPALAHAMGPAIRPRGRP
ncbi:MAG: hypothetical protein ABIP33_03345 [Pseudolysinimonas sp.]